MKYYISGGKNINISISSDIKTKPSNILLTELEKESRTLINEAMNILEGEKVTYHLSNEVDENPKVMEEWINKTKESQIKLGLLLKEHPRVFCLTAAVRNYRIKETALRIPKNYKQYILVWRFLNNENKCIIMASPDYSCASMYGVRRTSLDEVNVLYMRIVDVPKYIKVVQAKPDGSKEENLDIKILNKIPIMDFIFVEYFCPLKLSGTESKGTLVNFEARFIGKKRRYSACGLTVTYVLNYDGTNDQASQSNCLTDFYGKPSWVCSSIVLPNQ